MKKLLVAAMVALGFGAGMSAAVLGVGAANACLEIQKEMLP
jgi:hypothetical protein